MNAYGGNQESMNQKVKLRINKQKIDLKSNDKMTDKADKISRAKTTKVIGRSGNASRELSTKVNEVYVKEKSDCPEIITKKVGRPRGFKNRIKPERQKSKVISEKDCSQSVSIESQEVPVLVECDNRIENGQFDAETPSNVRMKEVARMADELVKGVKTPSTYNEAMKSTHIEKLDEAYEEEMNTMNKLKVYTLVYTPTNIKHIERKWVFKIRENELVEALKFKSRWVAKRYLK